MDTDRMFDFDPIIVADSCECPLTGCEREAIEGLNLCPMCRDYCAGLVEAVTQLGQGTGDRRV